MPGTAILSGLVALAALTAGPIAFFMALHLLKRLRAVEHHQQITEHQILRLLRVTRSLNEIAPAPAPAPRAPQAPPAAPKVPSMQPRPCRTRPRGWDVGFALRPPAWCPPTRSLTTFSDIVRRPIVPTPPLPCHDATLEARVKTPPLDPGTVPPARADTRAPGASGLDDVEDLFGRRLLTWAGIGILFLAAAFLLRLAYDAGWFGRLFTPGMRIGTLLLTAIAALIWGGRAMRQQHGALGQGLLGGGLGLLALTAFAAYKPGFLLPEGVALIGPLTAFASLAATSVLGFVLATRLDAPVLAHIALLCGLATPVLVSTGSGNRDALCLWLLLLDAGAIATAAWRGWRGLASVAAVGTMLLIGAWIGLYGQAFPQPDWATVVWLLAFQVLALSLPVLGRWRRSAEEVPVSHLLLPLGGAIAVLIASGTLFGSGLRHALAGVAMLLAVLHTLQTVGALRTDPRARAIGAVAVLSLVNLAVFLRLPGDVATWGWAVESAALYWLGWKLSLPHLRVLGSLLLALTALRGLATALPTTIDAALIPIANGWFATLLALPAACAVRAVIEARWATDGAAPLRRSIFAAFAGHGMVLLLIGEYVRLHLGGYAFGLAHPLPLILIIVAAAASLAGIAALRRSSTLWWGGAVWSLIAVTITFSAYRTVDPAAWWLLNTRGLIALSVVGAIAILTMTAAKAGMRPVLCTSGFITIGQLAVVLAVGETWALSQAHPEWFAGLGVLPLGWTLLLGALAHVLIAQRPAWALAANASLPALGLAALFALISYGTSTAWSVPVFNPRALLALAPIAVLLLARQRVTPPVQSFATIAPMLWLFLCATVEAACWPMQSLDDPRAAARIALLAVTATWSCLGLASLAAGMAWDKRPLRLGGLVVLAAAVGKLLLIDLHGTASGQRILVTVVVGGVCLAGGAAYQGLGQRRLRPASGAAGER